MPKIPKVARDINGTAIEQRQTDGFINGTAMCVAYDKRLVDWLRSQDALDLFVAVAKDLGVEVKGENSHLSYVSSLSATKYAEIFPGLILVKRGSPDSGGGSWLHPDLAIQLAQWCNKSFALQVSRWVREWMNSASNPVQLEADADRVRMRDVLKDRKRLEFTDQIKAFLENCGTYKPGSPETTRAFSDAHDYINCLLTTETAKQMRERLKRQTGKEISDKQLLRDYYPIEDLANFAAVCQAAANEMHRSKVSPKKAIDRAMQQVLSRFYEPKPIDFTEQIGLVRERIQSRDQMKFKSE